MSSFDRNLASVRKRLRANNANYFGKGGETDPPKKKYVPNINWNFTPQTDEERAAAIIARDQARTAPAAVSTYHNAPKKNEQIIEAVKKQHQKELSDDFLYQQQYGISPLALVDSWREQGDYESTFGDAKEWVARQPVDNTRGEAGLRSISPVGLHAMLGGGAMLAFELAPLLTTSFFIAEAANSAYNYGRQGNFKGILIDSLPSAVLACLGINPAINSGVKVANAIEKSVVNPLTNKIALNKAMYDFYRNTGRSGRLKYNPMILDKRTAPIFIEPKNILDITGKTVKDIDRMFPFEFPTTPGLQLKSLMDQSGPLFKAVNKTGKNKGMISVKQIEQIISSATFDKTDAAIIRKVLNKDFADKKQILFDELKRKVQKTIPTYNVRETERFGDYGIKSILNKDGLGQSDIYGGGELGMSRVYTNDNIYGNSSHFDNAIGHSRYMLDKVSDDLSALYIVENQSDLAQNLPSLLKNTKPIYQAAINTSLSEIDREKAKYILSDKFKQITKKEGTDEEVLSFFEKYYNNQFPELDKIFKNYNERQLFENIKFAKESGKSKVKYPTAETASKIEGFYDSVPRTQLNLSVEESEQLSQLRSKRIDLEIKEEELRVERNNYIKDTISPKIRETLEAFFKENQDTLKSFDSSTRMDRTEFLVESIVISNDDRYFFLLEPADRDAINKIVNEVRTSLPSGTIEKIQQYDEELREISIKTENISQTIDDIWGRAEYVPIPFNIDLYDSQYQTILRKYDKFPETVKRTLGKNHPLKTTYDTHGNSWYEFDIPENFNQMEIPYAKGGYLSQPTNHLSFKDRLSTVERRLQNR